MTRSGPIDATSIKAEKVRWLYRQYIAVGALHELAGRADKGKGVFAAHVAAHASHRGRVVISTAEEIPALMTVPRLEVAGANMDNVKFWRMWLPRDLNALAAYVREHHVKLLILDPLARHLSNGINRFTDSISRVLDPLQELCEDTGLAVLIVDHVNKKVSANEDPLNAVGGGSSGVGSAARAVYIWGLLPDDPDARYLCTVKCNMRLWHRGQDGYEAHRFEVDSEDHPVAGSTPLLVPNTGMLVDPISLLKLGSGMGRPPTQREEAEEWLRTYLTAARGPRLSSEIKEDARAKGISTKTLDKARKHMGVIVNPPEGGRYCTWQLPDTSNERTTA